MNPELFRSALSLTWSVCTSTKFSILATDYHRLHLWLTERSVHRVNNALPHRCTAERNINSRFTTLLALSYSQLRFQNTGVFFAEILLLTIATNTVPGESVHVTNTTYNLFYQGFIRQTSRTFWKPYSGRKRIQFFHSFFDK